MSTRVVVLGGGFAGVLSAARIARAAGSRASVTLVAASDAFVERVRFHEIAAGRTVRRWPLEALLRRHGVSFQHKTARALDAERRVLELEAADGQRSELEYDFLVYALGSTVDLRSVEGVAAHAESVADEASARALAARLKAAAEGAEIVVCGGGMTGVELATEIAAEHPRLRVRLLSRDGLCEPIVPAARAYLERALAKLSIEVETGVRVSAVREHELETDRGTRRFDVCIWAASFAVPPLARDAGFAVHPHGQLEVDPTLRSTSHPEVFGAGDAALPTSTVPIRMGCATAMPMAAQAADNLVALLRDRPLVPFRFAYLARFISLGRRDALAQYVRHDDSPRAWISTGRLAAWMKELTFRMNLFGLKTAFYPWKVSLIGAPRLPAPAVKALPKSASPPNA